MPFNIHSPKAGVMWEPPMEGSHNGINIEMKPESPSLRRPAPIAGGYDLQNVPRELHCWRCTC
jgi:hypothetical protein